MKLRHELIKSINGLFSKKILVEDEKFESAKRKFYYVFQIFFLISSLNHYLQSLNIHPKIHVDFCF